jgi:hypothetical protein
MLYLLKGNTEILEFNIDNKIFGSIIFNWLFESGEYRVELSNKSQLIIYKYSFINSNKFLCSVISIKHRNYLHTDKLKIITTPSERGASVLVTNLFRNSLQLIIVLDNIVINNNRIKIFNVDIIILIVVLLCPYSQCQAGKEIHD